MMVVTLQNGQQIKYNTADVLEVTFVDESSEDPNPPTPGLDPTTGPYAVGDYYCDGTNAGVVVEVDRTGVYGKIISLTDTGNFAWGPLDTITEAQDIDDGRPNMAVIAALDPGYNSYPAFHSVAALGEGWYLPAQRELQAVRKILDTVNPTLTEKGTPVEDAYYWSSSEADQFCDNTAYAADMSFPGMFGLNKNEELHVRGMRYFGEAPEPAYTVGKYVSENGVSGIVWWVSEDGTYAKVISLTEQTGAWGPVNTNVNAVSTLDGELNSNAAKGKDASLATYPAFKACADQGEKWYLPASEELAAIASLRTELNTSLSAASGTQLQSAYYWSSTEYSADPENSAVAVMLTDGATLGSSKSAVRNVRAVAYVGTRPEVEVTYAVGDVYREADQIVGIVCSVSDGGKHGRIIALKNAVQTGRINAIWDNRANDDEYININADSATDGAANMAAARANEPELANLIAFQVCAQLGAAWYLPAKDELMEVYNNKEVLNTALRANGGNSLDNKEYWTSTQGSADPAVRATSIDFKNGTTFDYRKYTYLLVRPMRAF